MTKYADLRDVPAKLAYEWVRTCHWGKRQFVAWLDDTGLFRRQTYNRFDVDKNFQSGIWTMV